MKPRRALLVATIAAGGLLVAFASGAAPRSASPFYTSDGGRPEGRTMLADYRQRDDGNPHKEPSANHDSDHRYSDHEHHADRDRDGDRGEHRRNGGSPAEAGSATPPDNGLILKGTTPKVQVN